MSSLEIQNYWIKRFYKSSLFDTALKLTGSKIINCLGDSHTKIFIYIAQQYLWFHTRFKFCIVEGGTAMGLVHPRSKTQALSTFRSYLQKISTNEALLFCLGEVDCGFLIWHRAEKYGVSVSEQFDLSLKNYIYFLNEVKKQGFKSIIVCSVPLPTILDQQTWGEVAKLRSGIKATLKKRTELTIQYNLELRNVCKKKDYFFLDFEKNILNPNKGVIDDCFRHPNPFDHHLNEKKISPTIVKIIREYGYW